MNRSSLWEMKERMKGTRRVVRYSWLRIMVVVVLESGVGVGIGGEFFVDEVGLVDGWRMTPWYRPTRAKGRRVVRRSGKP